MNHTQITIWDKQDSNLTQIKLIHRIAITKLVRSRISYSQTHLAGETIGCKYTKVFVVNGETHLIAAGGLSTVTAQQVAPLSQETGTRIWIRLTSRNYRLKPQQIYLHV